MNRIDDLASRYIAALRADDDVALAGVQLAVEPSEWREVMARVDAAAPELAWELDAASLAAAGEAHGLDAATAAAVATGMTADLATFLSAGTAGELDAVAERFCEAAPSLDAGDAEVAGRARFRLKQLAGGMLDARLLGGEAIAALAAATGQSVAYVRQLASAGAPIATAGMAARADEQRAGEGRPARVIEGAGAASTVDVLFGLGE